MPATQAHFEFGNECLMFIPDNVLNIINKYRDVYNFGVHGPDIFFYYRSLTKNEVNTYGSKLHHLPASGIFAHFKEVFLKTMDKDRSLAYIIGFLTHFCFDSTAHDYIESQRKKLGISHNKLEAEYESHLIRNKGLKPTTFDRSKTLVYSEETAKTIAQFFPFDLETVSESLKSHVKTIKMFHSPLGIKRNGFKLALKAIKPGSDYGDLFILNKEDSQCIESNKVLDRLKKEALDKFAILFPKYYAYLLGNDNVIDPAFEDDFG